MLDDGVAVINKMVNKAAAGSMPDLQPSFYENLMFDYVTVGMERYENSKQYGDRIDQTIRTWDDTNVTTANQVVLEDANTYRIIMVQRYLDDSTGLKMMRLYLERIDNGQTS